MTSIEDKNEKIVVPSISAIDAAHSQILENPISLKDCHKQEIDALIGTLSRKQFNRMIQDFDTASLIYNDDAMSGRGTKKPQESIQKVSLNVQMIAFSIDILSRLIKARYEQGLRDNYSKEERQIGAEYWNNIKTNFELLLKSIQLKRQDESATIPHFPSAE